MARDDLHFRLRIPEELKADIEEAARENRRSMTAEIVARLEASFDQSGLSDRLMDEAFTRGIQTATVQYVLGSDDPLAALEELRERLRKPIDVGKIASEKG